MPQSTLTRVLIVAAREPFLPGSPAPGKISQLIEHARRVVQRGGAVADVLDLGWIDQASGRNTVNAAAWIESVRLRWNAAQGIIVLVPERWNDDDSSLRFLLEELATQPGSEYNAVYGVVEQGADPQACEAQLAEQLEAMGLIPAFAEAAVKPAVESYPGYYDPMNPVVTDRTLHERVRTVARAVAVAAGKLHRLARGQRERERLESFGSGVTCGAALPSFFSPATVSNAYS